MRRIVQTKAILTFFVLLLVFTLSSCSSAKPTVGGNRTDMGTSGQNIPETHSIDNSILTKSASTVDTAKFKKDPPWHIHFAQYSAGLPILAHWRDRLIAEVKKDTRFVLTVSDGQNNPNKMVSDIEDAISKKVDLIIVQAGNGQVPVAAVERAEAAGIPVIAMQKEINTDKIISTVVGNDEEHGKLQAEAMVKELKNRNGQPKGKIIIINGTPGASLTVEMNKGFHKVIDQYQDIKVVVDQPANYRRDMGVQVLENAMQSNPDAQGVWFLGSDVGPGLAYAIEQAGKKDKMFVIGASGYMEELKLMLEGSVVTYDLTLPDCIIPSLDGARDILQGKPVSKKTLVLGKALTKETASQFYNPKILAVYWP